MEWRGRGKRWNMMENLDDQDFADDTCLLSQSSRDIQENTERVAKYGRKLGLKINTKETKYMIINSERNISMKLGEEDIERVSEFIHLGAKETRRGEERVRTLRR